MAVDQRESRVTPGLRPGGRDPGLRPRPSWPARLLRPRSGLAQGEPVAGSAKFQRLVALSEPPGRLQPLPGTTCCRVTYAAARSRQARGAPPFEPGRRGYPGGPVRRPRRPTGRTAGRSSRPSTSCTRANSRSSPPTRSWASRGAPGRSSTTPSTPISSPRRSLCRSWARLCCSAAIRRRPTGSSSRSEPLRSWLRPSRTRDCS